MSRLKWACAMAMRSLATAIVGVVSTTTPAVAATSSTINIVASANIRSGPSADYQLLTTMPAGSRPDHICYTNGQNVHGTTVWFQVNYNGINGYYTSYADDVPLEKQSNLEGNYGIAKCGSSQPTEVSAKPTATSTSSNYDQTAAANYAYQHATDLQPITWSGCAWLASESLWIGGIPQTDEWNGYSVHKTTLTVIPGTVTATVAPMTVEYLQSMGWATTRVILGYNANNEYVNDNAVSDARIGDIIAYDWDTEGSPGIDHLSIVVDIAPGNYPEVAEWRTAELTPTINYNKRGWTWSEIKHKWLLEGYPHMKVTLVHITY